MSERQLQIQTGSVRRLAKDLAYTLAEVQRAQARVQESRDQGQDEHEIRHRVDVLRDHEKSVPDTATRLRAAMATLQDSLAAVADTVDQGVVDTATSTLTDAKTALARAV